jgi:O-antigen ligase
MPPTLALLLWLILLLALFWYDPAKAPGMSALWVPTIWLFIIGSKLPSQWLGGSYESAAQTLQEGNPLDRSIDLVLIVLAIVILISRSFEWGRFLRCNFILMLLLMFALVSVLWSDFPFVAFKRWFRDLGNYLMILVVLSDPRPLEAVGTLLRRLSYLLLPLCILLIRYYPNIGMQYDFWTGARMFVGATTGKNMLGVLCLISGLFFFWDTVTRWSKRKDKRTKRILMVNFAFMWMTLWLLGSADSATSRVCLGIGCLVIVAAHSRFAKRHPGFLKAMIPAFICLYAILAFGFGINGQLAGAVGRDSTMTGRTNVWDAVLSTRTNPLIGTGYESFWLGPRLLQVWQRAGVGIQEAHNGYLEVYLQLGLIGVFLVCGFLIASYQTICKRLKPFSNFASLSLALWTDVLFFNMTEAAAFKGQLMWVIFLLGAVVVPRATSAQNFTTQRSPFEKSPSTLREAVTI